jgi:hypothetical protein
MSEEKKKAAVSSEAAHTRDGDAFAYELEKLANNENTTMTQMMSQLQSMKMGIPKMRAMGKPLDRIAEPRGRATVLAKAGKCSMAFPSYYGVLASWSSG